MPNKPNNNKPPQGVPVQNPVGTGVPPGGDGMRCPSPSETGDNFDEGICAAGPTHKPKKKDWLPVGAAISAPEFKDELYAMEAFGRVFGRVLISILPITISSASGQAADHGNTANSQAGILSILRNKNQMGKDAAIAFGVNNATELSLDESIKVLNSGKPNVLLNPSSYEAADHDTIRILTALTLRAANSGIKQLIGNDTTTERTRIANMLDTILDSVDIDMEYKVPAKKLTAQIRQDGKDAPMLLNIDKYVEKTFSTEYSDAALSRATELSSGFITSLGGGSHKNTLSIKEFDEASKRYEEVVSSPVLKTAIETMHAVAPIAYYALPIASPLFNAVLSIPPRAIKPAVEEPFWIL